MVCNFTKTLLHGCFSRFLNCTNGTKSRNAQHLIVLSYCFQHLAKQSCLLKSFPAILILRTQASFYVFSFSRTNLKLHNIHVAPKVVKKVISNLDLFKTFGLDFNLVVVLKSFESELSYLEQILFSRLLESLVPFLCI